MPIRMSNTLSQQFHTESTYIHFFSFSRKTCVSISREHWYSQVYLFHETRILPTLFTLNWETDHSKQTNKKEAKPIHCYVKKCNWLSHQGRCCSYNHRKMTGEPVQISSASSGYSVKLEQAADITIHTAIWMIFTEWGWGVMTHILKQKKKTRERRK